VVIRYMRLFVGGCLLLQHIEPVRKKLSLVGMGAMVLVDGKTVASAVCGKRRQKSDVAVTVDDKWHWGSITKSMTATVVARLVERSELSWDSTLPVMLPDMASQMHSSWNEVTLHHVLTHSAGLPRDFPMSVQFSRPKELQKLHEKRRDEISAVLAQSAASPPGKSHAYSNVGYTLAGLIAAENRNTTWEALIEKELFAPLKIRSAGFGPPQGSEPLDQPWGHQRVLFMRNPVDPSKHGDNSPVMGPAGIVHMSMGDLARFGWEHLLGGRTCDLA
jgi:CubicO group peptidase (beta-lactamase class C family)